MDFISLYFIVSTSSEVHVEQDQNTEKDEIPSCSKNKNGRLSTILIMDKKFYREDTGVGLYSENSENMIPGRHICSQNNRTFCIKTFRFSWASFTGQMERI